MDVRGHEEYGYPEHSLDLMGKVVGQYRVTCRYIDAKTANGYFIPVWRCVNPRGDVLWKFEYELVQMSRHNPQDLA